LADAEIVTVPDSSAVSAGVLSPATNHDESRDQYLTEILVRFSYQEGENTLLVQMGMETD
jgi:hypothetical protein